MGRGGVLAVPASGGADVSGPALVLALRGLAGTPSIALTPPPPTPPPTHTPPHPTPPIYTHPPPHPHPHPTLP